MGNKLSHSTSLDGGVYHIQHSNSEIFKRKNSDILIARNGKEFMIADYAIEVSDLNSLFSNKGWQFYLPNPNIIQNANIQLKYEKNEKILEEEDITEIDKNLKANENILLVSFMGCKGSGKTWLINEIFGKNKLHYNSSLQENWEVFYYSALACGFVDTPSVPITCQNDVIVQNILNNLSIAVGSVHIITATSPDELHAWLKSFYHPMYNILFKNEREPPTRLFVHILQREKSNFTNYFHSLQRQFGGKVFTDSNAFQKSPRSTTTPHHISQQRKSKEKMHTQERSRKKNSTTIRSSSSIPECKIEFLLDKDGNRHYVLGHSSFLLNIETIRAIETHLISLLSLQSTVTKKNSFQIIKDTFYDTSCRVLSNFHGESHLFLRKQQQQEEEEDSTTLNVRITSPFKSIDFSNNCLGCYFNFIQNEEDTTPYVAYEFPNECYVIVIESEKSSVTIKRLDAFTIRVSLRSLTDSTLQRSYKIHLGVMYNHNNFTLIQSFQVIVLIFPFIPPLSSDSEDLCDI